MPDTPSSPFHAARIHSALQERIIGHQALFEQSNWFVFFIESGRAIAQTQSGDYEMTGPAILWGPLTADTRLQIGAGSVGSYLLFSDRILADAIGLIIEAAELHLFAQQPVMLSFARNDPRGPELEGIFERITAEGQIRQFGAEIAISAYVRLLLVLLWRSVDKETSDRDLIGGHKAKLNQFRNLVEAHFRSRWKAKHYADVLGLTYDRLHDLCMRALDKPPALLIRERSFREAQVLLQRTSHSADHISALLGFSSASQFNHFYKAMSGEAPGVFRRRITRAADDPMARDPVRFSDWP
ncbi:MAG: helix-turn-helix domain-containing protein [Rhodobacteraceae bacterium]|nr:helix-turn-helix domain-containing protein [Paracoccaceae bacterium]